MQIQIEQMLHPACCHMLALASYLPHTLQVLPPTSLRTKPTKHTQPYNTAPDRSWLNPNQSDPNSYHKTPSSGSPKEATSCYLFTKNLSPTLYLKHVVNVCRSFVDHCITCSFCGIVILSTSSLIRPSYTIRARIFEKVF